MDTRPRGRGRQNPQPRLPGNPRFEGARPGPPRQPGGYAPRTPWRQPAQVPPPGFNQIRVPRPQARPQGGNQHLDLTQAVERGISNLSLGSGVMPVPVGRGAVRGSRVLDTEVQTEPYYRVPRPESSQKGKEGTSGQPLNLVANYFPLKSYTEMTLYQYRVDFSPEEDRIGLKRGLLGVHRTELGGGYLFDGTMMFSTTKYKSNVLTLSSKREVDDQIVTITVSFTNVLERHDYTYIQVFNLILRNGLRHLNLSLVGRNYYDPAAKISIPRHKLQLWPGYETTIGMFDSGLLLRAEISTKVMRDESVLDFFRDCLQNNRNQFMDVFKAGVIGTVVLTRYNNQTYRVDDIDESASPKSTFKMKDGSQMSYLDYYKKKWDITLRDANQPMLLSKKKKSLVKNEDEILYLVPELCSLTGITEHMRENFALMKELSNYTRVDPMERINRYNNFIKRLQSNEKCAGSFNDWNLQLDPNLVNIKGRVIAPQRIYCNTKMYEAGEKADWTNHVRGLPMFTSASLVRWAIVYPNQNEQEVRSFVNSLRQVADKMHFSIPTPQPLPINAYNMQGYLTALEEVINQSNPSFILCVIPSPRGDLYKLIKGRLSVDRAVPSQVVLLKNVSKNNLSVCTKIAIQINCKLGGAPWRIAIPTPGIMIIGFDVCHDKQHKNKSYGALVATLNDSHTKYYSCVRPHPSGQELSANFNTSIAGALAAYKKHNNQKLPDMIIIYRDGVGDGQVSYVHKTEVAMVKQTCQTFYGSQVVKMAFIIVKKRISTRFFSVPQAGSRPTNPPPGTVVDSVITDPSMYDFFLVSQHVTFGTVTPTHYNVIVDTLPEWSPTKMQLLTYKLTHMYYNWSGTVRVPAPCQLAHKLAFFTAKALQTTPNVALNELLYFL